MILISVVLTALAMLVGYFIPCEHSFYVFYSVIFLLVLVGLSKDLTKIDGGIFGLIILEASWFLAVFFAANTVL